MILALQYCLNKTQVASEASAECPAYKCNSACVVMSLRRLSQAAQEAAALLARRWSSSSASCSSCTAPGLHLASGMPTHLAMPRVVLQQVWCLSLFLLKSA